MKNNGMWIAVIAVVAILVFLGGSGLKSVILAPNDFTPEKYCTIDGSKYFMAEPVGILVQMNSWSDTNGIAQTAIFEGQEFTPSSLVVAVKNYISKYCTLESDYCINQKQRAGTDDPIAISASIFVRNDGLYFDNYKVLKSDQKFRTILLERHSEITDQLSYNRQYIGGLYGTNDAYNFKCVANYGITNPITTTTTISTTTTTIGGELPITNAFTDFITSIIDWIVNLVGGLQNLTFNAVK